MVDDHRELIGLLRALGAPDVAHHLAIGGAPATADLTVLRDQLQAATAAARSLPDTGVLVQLLQEAAAQQGPGAATIRALVAADPSLAAAPSATASTQPVRSIDSAPFAVSLAGRPTVPRPDAEAPQGGSAPVEDDLVWAAAALTVLPAAALLFADFRHFVVLAPIIYAVQVTLLVVDRVHLSRSGQRPPGWVWVVFPPAYLFRRNRGLGRQPTQAYVFVAVGVLARVAIGVLGLGPGLMVDTASLATSLNEVHEQRWEMQASTSCDRWVSATIGAEFTCTTRFVNGGTYSIEFEVLTETGEIAQGQTSLRNFTTRTGFSP